MRKALEINSSNNVATVSSGLPFVQVLADSWNQEKQLGISSFWFMPNIRACIEMRKALIKKVTGNTPVLLPTIEPITSFKAETWIQLGVSEILDLPQIVPASLKHGILMQLVSSYRKHNNKKTLPPHRLLSYAQSLDTLMQEFILHKVSISKLENCEQGNLSEHWKENLNFFSNVIFKYWSELLDKTGRCEKNEFEWALLNKAEEAWKSSPPSSEIVIAGSTGARPTTAKLMSLVRRLKNGSVILPSFITDTESSDSIILQPIHPKYCIRRWLKNENLKNSDITVLKSKSKLVHAERIAKLVSAFSFENRVSDVKPNASDYGLHRIDCKNEAEEVAVIVLLILEKLNDSSKSEPNGSNCIIITYDINLAKRIEDALWVNGIKVINNLGTRLLFKAMGKWIMLISEIISGKHNGVIYLDLLNHMFTRSILSGEELNHYDNLLRQKQDGITTADILSILESSEHSNKDKLISIASKVNELFKPLFVSNKVYSGDLNKWIEIIESAIDKMVNIEFIENSSVYSSEWKSWNNLISSLKSLSYIYPEIKKYELPQLIKSLLKQNIGTSNYNSENVEILTPIDARYATADRIIFAGFNDCDWPKDDKNIWLSMGLRSKLKMEPQDTIVGLTANDIIEFCHSSEIYFTRSKSYDGIPTLPSRWLGLWRNYISADNQQIEWYKKINGFGNIKLSPRPPELAKIDKSFRPNSISVSGVKTLIEDPYNYYTKYILKLRPKDGLILSPSALNFGNLVHKALESFLIKHNSKSIKKKLSSELFNDLVLILQSGLNELFINQSALAEIIWMPKLNQLCSDYINIQKNYVNSTDNPIFKTELELVKTFKINNVLDNKITSSNNEEIEISARCDLIRHAEFCYEIVDYKTASNITKISTVKGIDPQLGIEAWILQDTANNDKSIISNISIWHILKTGHLKELNFNLEKNIDIKIFSNKLLLFLYHFMFEDSSSYFKIPANNIDIKQLSYKRQQLILSRQFEWNIGI